MGASSDPTVPATAKGGLGEGPNSTAKSLPQRRLGSRLGHSMGVKRRQGSGNQMDLFDEALKASLRHGATGEGGTGTGAIEEQQTPTAGSQGNGVPEWRAWILALSGKGWWRMAASPPAHEAMPTAWFNTLGLVRLASHHAALNAIGNRRGT